MPFASIPSPSSGAIHIGSFQIRAYGLMIALGVVAAVKFASVRWRERGGNPEDISAIATWAVPAGLIGARRRGRDATLALDACAPAIALAQAIGRWGNWFNQELFGRPTTLPWALRIDPAHRPDKYLDKATFHPTFLYESLWCLLVVAVVLLVERRYRLRPGGIFAVYVATYTVGRAWIEALRVDD